MFILVHHTIKQNSFIYSCVSYLNIPQIFEIALNFLFTILLICYPKLIVSVYLAIPYRIYWIAIYCVLVLFWTTCLFYLYFIHSRIYHVKSSLATRVINRIPTENKQKNKIKEEEKFTSIHMRPVCHMFGLI